MSATSDSSRRLAARLDQIPGDVLAELRPALVKAAEDVAAKMRALAPVDTGALRDSIAVTGPGQTTPAYASDGGRRTIPDNQAVVTVGSPAMRHGHLVEFGTVTMEAQPFTRPAWRIARPRILSRLSRAIGKAIRKAGSHA
ncbi:HK97 gp10 family phage protein [Rhodobacter sphaeroides]|jgi:phage protein, HK97 gp10 family|uniref:Phage protein, HK97 gp10 family n=1 Tax=Cereibacter sphaeroides (strain ATCC 17023 / DSM 158 / JCM 6121 / CCUG 31486 / LMG 2827 / NBRC 12203 / NCIMB 8253 / ATH 2.4.1.) TaxID=272943 RepID=Q3J3X1_CERS4|nr:HK97-gp10 family putative phage morphogenesis protein [Cereibacter sphaeroides]ABA78513.1 phage protein, HK97 gp10 family [Cereibacter sphaeroides 2.4.1]AXC60733.1 HK97 gp10 family phage protein [Cereibacter sphaeroides 2.4.1]MVX48291.1 HK97 gp10 family phage protein [Cereibacter sphaeroides]QHA10670.1 HK97 gp10 family phage protein [Cereibacter sphaeroides]QHA12983.1 HK97 gp10 family phage protein [Cereibacter sphaeroides]